MCHCAIEKQNDHNVLKDKISNLQLRSDDRFEKKVLGYYYRQFSFHLAHAITVHRAQDQTYDAVNIDPDCLDSCHLYVSP